jgi:hypothetical protein
VTASTAERYAHLLDKIQDRIDLMPHLCQVWEPIRMEYYTRPELCDRCQLERILESEPSDA